MLQLLVQYIYSKSKFASIRFPLESTPECQKQRSLREGCILAWSAASVQFSGGLTVSMTLVGRQRCELCACHEWGDVSPTNTNQPTLPLPIITQYLFKHRMHNVTAACHVGTHQIPTGPHLCTPALS